MAKKKSIRKKRGHRGAKNIAMGGSYPIRGGRMGAGATPYFITQYIEPARPSEPAATTTLDWVRGEKLPHDVKERLKSQKAAAKIAAPSGMLQVRPTPKAPSGKASLSREMDFDFSDVLPSAPERMDIDMGLGGMPYVEREVPTRGEGKSLLQLSMSEPGGVDYKRPSVTHRPLEGVGDGERMDVDMTSMIQGPSVAEPMTANEPRRFAGKEGRPPAPSFAPANQVAPNRVIQPRDVTPLQPPSEDAMTGPTLGVGRSLGIPQGVVGGGSRIPRAQRSMMTAEPPRELALSQIDPALVRAIAPWPPADRGIPLPKFQDAQFTFPVRGEFDRVPSSQPVQWPEPTRTVGQKRPASQISTVPPSGLRRRVVAESTKKSRKGDNLRSINLDGKMVRI